MRRSRTILRFVMKGVTFNNSISYFLISMNNHPNFAPSEWIFEECEFDCPYAGAFFECFIKFQGSIRVLTFNRCKFTKPLFGTFCQTVLFSRCFYSLETLWITDVIFPDDVVSFLIQLFGSDWLTKTQSIRTLAVIDCCLQVDQLFSQIQDFKTGIVTFNFSGNTFYCAPILKSENSLSPQLNLIFSKCAFADDALAGLFTALSNHKGRSLQLDCCSIYASADGWKLFSKIETTIVLPTLTGLVWDKNPITTENVNDFISFLKNQPKLSTLSISDCITNDSSILKSFLLYFRVSSLQSLTIRSTTKQTVLGPALTPLIEAAMMHSTLKSLDITGQCIGDFDIIKIIRQMKTDMETFYFEGNNISTSTEQLIQILEMLLKKNLKTFSWPENDLKKVLLNLPEPKRIEANMKINNVKNEYIKKYGNISCNENNSIDITNELNTIMEFNSKIEPNLEEKNECLMKIGFKHKNTSKELINNVVFRAKDNEIEELMRECGVNGDDDPIREIYDTLSQEFTIENLKNSLFNH
ncbi:Leucine Rich Repeat family protein [Histomonas meleagridis]|uniref:Leucine Rich Repeat family protein n=1 Tax=Histomonas meleagridis TaxID=135588 RepID=UPI003559A8F7|nr:Leucine Rich Repeat family protein [Histomonas meleagridis]KAH0806781.1 Leucine Rich Repeat family protein [Histomonas meleagridis]